MKEIGNSIITVLALVVSVAQAQQPQAQPRSQTAGIVTTVDAAANRISFTTEKGDAISVTTTDKTQIVHALPGETDVKKWAKIGVGDVTTGDQVVVYYRGAIDQKPLVATSVVVRTKADLNQLAQNQLDDWKKRGTTGTVTAVDAETISIKTGQKSFTVKPAPKTDYHRYSLDSAKVADAKPSNLAEIKVGDQVNVLGDKAEDGVTIKAESIYAGTFRQIAATIVSIDPATGELKVTDLATKKPLTIRVGSESAMKKLPEPLAQGLARRYQSAGRGQGAAPPAGGGGRGADMGQAIDHLPAMSLSELKPKDAIMVSTTMGSDPTKVTAITLLAGVEPILTAAPNATRDIMSGWNLGGGGGEGN